jgi:hypothetical protein
LIAYISDFYFGLCASFFISSVFNPALKIVCFLNFYVINAN